MKKEKVISEAQLRDIVTESVKNILSELDWKTYANAARKRLSQAFDTEEKFKSTDDKDDLKRKRDLYDRAFELNHMAKQRFDDEYIGDMDKTKGERSTAFFSSFAPTNTHKMALGGIRGHNKGGDKIFSPEKGVYRAGRDGVTFNGVDKSRLVSPGKFFRDKEMGKKYKRANDELWDYANGNYEYEPDGRGWRLKDEN